MDKGTLEYQEAGCPMIGFGDADGGVFFFASGTPLGGFFGGRADSGRLPPGVLGWPGVRPFGEDPQYAHV